jgi:hypothetical protein
VHIVIGVSCLNRYQRESLKSVVAQDVQNLQAQCDMVGLSISRAIQTERVAIIEYAVNGAGWDTLT